MKIITKIKSQINLYAIALLICMYALYNFYKAEKSDKIPGRLSRANAPIVRFEHPKLVRNFDPWLPWWEQRSKEACGRFLFDEIYLNTSAVEGNCGLRAYNAGKNQKVISYTLYGTNPLYWQNLDRILETVKKLYPGWVVRLHTEPSKYQHVLCHHLLKHSHLHVCDVTNLPELGDQSQLNPLMWRMLPLADPQVQVFIARDLDSQLLEREAAAVGQWLRSEALLHVMRDHATHALLAVPGDTWGVHQPASARQLIHMVKRNIFKVPRHKNFLHYYLWALKSYLMSVLKTSIVQHDSYSCSRYKETVPFPTRRVNATYVGNSFYRTGFSDIAIDDCPAECRPEQFKNWTTC